MLAASRRALRTGLAPLLGPRVDWGLPYPERREGFLHAVLGDAKLLGRFARGARLPLRYGIGLDERVIEYPWLLAQQPRGRALDAGSTLNHPYVLEYFLALVETLDIVTLAPEEHAYPELGVIYRYCDLRDLPFDDGSFDSVISLSTLEHVGMETAIYGHAAARADDPGRELLRAVGELRRVLAPGGRLFLSVPYGAREDHGWVRQLDAVELEELLDALEGLDPVVHLFRYTRPGWQRSDLEEAAGETYRDMWADPSVPDDLAVAARAVACIVATS